MTSEAGGQTLKYYLDLARNTAAEAASKLEGPLAHLERIDRLFMDFIPSAGALRPQTAGVLILNAHAALRAGIDLALSGQLLPVFMCLRGSLESALYANAMVGDKDLETIWLSRDRDAGARSKCRKAFTIENIIKHLATAQDAAFAERVMDAYQSTIDFGAHPNSRSVLRSLSVKDLPSGHRSVSFTYMYSSDSGQVGQALVACAEIGLLVFYIALIACPSTPAVTALNQRALAAQEEVNGLVRELGLLTPSQPQA